MCAPMSRPSRLTPGRGMRAAPLAIAVLAVAIALACEPSPAGPRATLVVTDGGAAVETGGSTTAVQGERLVGAGAKVVTDDQGIAMLSSPDGTKIELLPRTALVLDEFADNELSAVTILSGRMQVSVARADERVGLKLSTEVSTVALQRAQVFMAVERTGLTEVEILEGSAQVTAGEKTVAGEAGQVLVTRPGLQPYRADPLTRRPAAQSPLATPLPLTVTESKYGVLSVSTAPGARCFGRLSFPRPEFGDMPGTSVTGQADPSGVLRWTYPTPRLPAGAGSYAVTCVAQGRSGDATGSFDVELRPILASALLVKVIAYDIDPDGTTAAVNEALLPLRGRAVDELRSTLPAEWRTATRGLGKLDVVEGGEDVIIRVIAATGISSHYIANDGTEAIAVYVADRHGPESLENLVATALHELGHIWCCDGEGTADGHWSVAQPDPRLTGIDRFGLMNHPVTCFVLQGGVVSCPNRFSERELRAFGFQNIPPP